MTDGDETLQQLPLTRWVGFGGGLLIAAAGVLFIAVAADLGWPWVLVGALAFVAGLIMAVRAPGGRVVLHHEAVQVRGLFWSRTIPRSAIVAITPWPFIKWKDPHGRTRSTPVTIMNASGALSPFRRRASENSRKLHEWADVGGDFLHTDA